MSIKLERDGYNVQTFLSGDAAFEAAKEGLPDLLISDAVMPGRLQGLDLIRALKEQRPALPTILMSGYTDVFVTDRSAPILEDLWLLLLLARRPRPPGCTTFLSIGTLLPGIVR